MRKLKILPALALMILVGVICAALGARYAREEKIVREAKQTEDGFSVVCPRLSRCGDAFLLFNDRGAVMIDTGEAKDEDIVMDMLRDNGVESLNALILTHFDKDHIGGAPAVIRNFPVKRCYLTCGSEDSDEFKELMNALKKTGTKQLVVTEPETFRAMDAEFTIYPPLSALFEKNQDNNLSLITAVNTPGEKLLFTGDAQKERMQQFMESQYDGTQYTWLKVPHHGRDKGPVKMLLKEFVPAKAVITSSKDEPENEEVIELLQDKGVEVTLTRKGTEEFFVSTVNEPITSGSAKQDGNEIEHPTDFVRYKHAFIEENEKTSGLIKQSKPLVAGVKKESEAVGSTEESDGTGSGEESGSGELNEGSGNDGSGENLEAAGSGEDSGTDGTDEGSGTDESETDGDEDEDEDADSVLDEEEDAGENDNSKKKKKKVDPPVFSKEAGFYDKPFSLKLKAEKGTKIYYTLDCSVPTEESERYTTPISVEDPTPNPNVYSARLDMRPYRPQNVSRYYTEIAPGWFSGDILCGNVDKCQVVRAVAVDKEGNQSDVVTASYFIGYKNRKGYKGVAVLSLVSDPVNLFDDDIGIMVNGTTYRETWLSGKIDGIKDTHRTRKYCNTYAGRGKKWEREVHLDFFQEKDRSHILSQEAGIRLHGNQSRVSQPQKSFNLYAREEYDGNDTFLIPFYKTGILQDKVTLMRGDDVRNYFLSDKMNHRTMDTQNYRMTHVFLEGEYWGIYAIQEKYHSDEYLRTHYNLEDEDYIMAKGTPEGYDIKQGDPKCIKTSFRMLRDFAANNDLSKPENYQIISSMMDMQSFIDGYAARLYLGDQDWNWFKNHYLLFYDQKWHWLVFDMDYGASLYNNTQPETNTFLTPRLVRKYSLETDPLFPFLLKNASFKRQFFNTFLDMGNEVFQAAKMKKEIEAFQKKYYDASILEAYRHITTACVDNQGNPNWISGMYQMCEKMKTYFDLRFPYAADYAADYCGIKGKQAEITIVNDDPKGGTVKCNTVTPTLNKKGKWTGTYYTGCPIILAAEPKEGWVFEGWETDDRGELSGAGTLKKRLTFTGDTVVRASFRKK